MANIESLMQLHNICTYANIRTNSYQENFKVTNTPSVENSRKKSGQADG